MDDADDVLLLHSPSFLEVEEEEGKTRKNALHINIKALTNPGNCLVISHASCS
jgi:hypothetical protein